LDAKARHQNATGREKECQGNWVEIGWEEGFVDLWQIMIYLYVRSGKLVCVSASMETEDGNATFLNTTLV